MKNRTVIGIICMILAVTVTFAIAPMVNRLTSDDRTLKDTLQPVVAKLTDVRVVNNELRTMLSSVRNEYWMMVALVAGNIPLLYFLNREWFNTLMFTTPGKVVLGICGMVILITALFMMKFTKPIAYKR